MQIYCGTDIIEVSRIEDAIENTKEFKENIFTDNEIKDIDSIKSRMKYQRYAGRFAAKEAIYKAISKLLVVEKISMSFLDVEIENVEEQKNRPRVIVLNEKMKEMFEKYDIQIDVSISHINENAVGMAIVKQNIE